MQKRDKEKKLTLQNQQEGTGKEKNEIDTDPLGMYTGVPDDPNEKPTQDADDL